MNNTPQYEYADGSGNWYTLSPTTLAFVPVKLEESSSGTYSGGKAKAVRITTEQFDSLRLLLEKAISNSSIHIQDRVKMSGVISVVDEKERKQYIIQPGSEELAVIEALLKGILGQ